MLQDRIAAGRTRKGMSRAELAANLSVDEATIAAWETGAASPDPGQICRLAEVFGVTTDELLKEPDGEEKSQNARKLTARDAEEFLRVRAVTGWKIAFGVLLCILSPAPLILLAVFADAGVGGISEPVAAAVGLAAMFLLVGTAVVLFISARIGGKPYEDWERNPSGFVFGTVELIEDWAAGAARAYATGLPIGVFLCVIAPLPLVVTAAIRLSDLIVGSMVPVLLALVALGVFIIIRVTMKKNGYDILLQRGEFTPRNRERTRKMEAISSLYWGIVTLAYFGLSFWTGRWDRTWIIWPVAGVLYSVVLSALKLSGKDLGND